MKLHFSRLRPHSRTQKLIGLGIVVCLIVLLIGLWHRWHKEPLYIAMLAPMSGFHADAGIEMVKSTELYLQQINDRGGIQGHPVKLWVKDDEGSPEVGQQRAKEIVADERITIALGSWLSSVSIPVGKIYEQAGLPAITGTASSDRVTTENTAYFQVTPNTKQQGIFLANYLKKVLKTEQVTMISDSDDAFSQTLANSFMTTFQGLGGTLKYQFDLANEREASEFATESLVDQLLQIDAEDLKTVAIFTLGDDAAQLIIDMKRSGLEVPIVGGESLSNNTFKNYINQRSEEFAQPGYFSDGIYVSTALLYDTADEATQVFRTQFLAAYAQEPTWSGAASYDAIKVALTALERSAMLNTNAPIKVKRQAVRRELLQMKTPEYAVQGLQGSLQFNEQRTVENNHAMGVAINSRLVSAPQQLRYLDPVDEIQDPQAQLAAGQLIYAGGRYSYITPVVYTGIEINEVSDLKLRNETYEIDFLLWFRYPETLDAEEVENIEFIDSADPITLGEPFYEAIEDGMNVKAFRLKIEFKTSFDFREYPFDSQQLQIAFRNQISDRRNILYIPDMVGMESFGARDIREKVARNNVLRRLSTWEFKDARFFETTDSIASTLGNPKLTSANSGIDYSLFTFVLEIKRKWLAFSINDILPLSCFVWLLYLLLFQPFEKMSPESISGILLAVVFFHIGLRINLPNGVAYLTGLDVVFYVVYTAIMLQTLLFLIAVKLKKKIPGEHVFWKVLRWTKAAFPLYFLIAAISIGLYYDVLSPQKWMSAHFAPTPSPGQQVEQPTESLTTDEQVTITLQTWKPEYTKAFRQLFNQKAQANDSRVQNITLNHLAVPYFRYGEVLPRQLQSEAAPDLMFLQPYVDEDFFIQEHLLDLTAFPGIAQTYTPQNLEPWSTANGRVYGLPLGSVIHGVFYNADLFEQVGITIPQTWEELLHVAKQLQSAGILPFANNWGNSDDELYDPVFVNLFPNFTGGRTGRLAYERGDRCFNDAQMVRAYEALAEISPYLDPEPRSQAISKQRFLHGKAAMWISGSWELAIFKAANPDFNWSVFPVPAPAGQTGHVVFHPDFAIGINANSPHLEAAKRWLAWTMTPEGADFISNELVGNFLERHNPPPLKDPIAQLMFSFTQERGTDVRWTYPQLHNKIPVGNTLSKASAKGVILGKITPQEAADRLQQGLAEWYIPAQTCGRSQP